MGDGQGEALEDETTAPPTVRTWTRETDPAAAASTAGSRPAAARGATGALIGGVDALENGGTACGQHVATTVTR
jgi:hypothetical protein